jgi:branched-chain amino acid transport system substrate-binding protein
MKGRGMWMGFLVFFLVCLLAVPCFAQRGVTKDTIKLGLILVKTGPVAALGLPNGNGMVDYLQYLNDTAGGVAGRKIEVIWEDDSFEAPKSVAALKKLITRDNVLTVITTGGSQQTMANLENINQYKLPNIPNALMKEFYEPFQPYIFAMGATYEAQFECIVDYIFNDLKEKKPRIGVVYEKKEYGIKGMEAVKKRAKAYGVDLISELALPTGAVDAGSQVLTLMNDKVDYVVTCLLLPPTITFVKSAEQYKYWPKHIFGFNWATDDMLVKACGEAAKNYIGVNFVGAWWDESPGIKLVRQIAQKYNRTEIGLTSLYINGVGVSMLFAEGFKRAGKDLTPDSLRAALETLKDYSTGGVLPPITYTSKSHEPAEMVKFFKADVVNKRLVTMTDWRKPKAMK